MEGFDPFESNVAVGDNKNVRNNANPLLDDVDDLLGGPLNGNPPMTSSVAITSATTANQQLLDFDDFAPNDPLPPMMSTGPPVAQQMGGAGSFEDDDMIEIPQESFTKLPESMMTSIHYDEEEDEVEVETASDLRAPPSAEAPQGKGDASEEKMLKAEMEAQIAAEKEAEQKAADKAAAEKAAAEKAAAEKAAKEAAEKVAAEKAAKESAEKAAAEKAAKEAAEKAAAEKAAKEAAEKAAREAAKKAEKEAAEKVAREAAEMAEKEAAEKAAREAAEKAEKEAAEKAAREAAEKAEKEAAEKAAREAAERKAAEEAKEKAEREAAEKAAAEKAANEAAEREAAEKAAKEAKEKAEKEAAEKAAAEKAAKEAAERAAAEEAARLEKKAAERAAAEESARLEKEAAERAVAEESAKKAAAEKEAAEKAAAAAATRPPILITEPADDDHFEEPDSSFDDYVNVPAAPIIKGEIESEKKKKAASSAQSPVEHVDLFGFLRNVPPAAMDLIYWRRPIHSAVTLSGTLALLISFTYFSVISVVANASLIVLVVAFAYVGFKRAVAAVQKTNDGHPFKELLASPPQELIPGGGDCVKKAVGEALTSSIACLVRLRHYFLCVDLIDSLKFGLALYVMTYIGDTFNLLTLLTIGVVLLFSLPKIYEVNKKQIDSGVEQIMAQIMAQIPVYKALVFDRVVEMWRKVAVYVPGVGGGAPAVRETPKNK